MTSLPFAQDLTACFEITNGFDEAAFANYQTRTLNGVGVIQQHYDDNTLPMLRVAEREDDLEKLAPIAKKWRQDFKHVVVIGTGGSSSGGQALCDLRLENANPKISFIDNVSIRVFDHFLASLDLDHTGFIVISKSGRTAEPLAQFLAILELLHDKEVKDRTLVITEDKNNPLCKLAAEFDIPRLDHDPDIGGRFSVLSLVGVLPAMMAGLDVSAIRKGAIAVLQDTLTQKENSVAAKGAAAAVYAMERMKLPMQVFLPYIEQMQAFSLWYRQLWGESIGKEKLGSTPVNALGPVDQHSQLQLYLGGPEDKFYTVLVEDVAGCGAAMDAHVASKLGLDYLEGKKMGDLLAAQQKATIETLANNDRPTRVFKMKAYDEATVGALMMHFMLETIIAADLMGVDAFDQPAVEQGKVLTKEYLRAGKSLKLNAA